ncbi:MAG: PD40 domain-containing protein [Flavobacteriales bacterium]|nr:PD40 domain-containing protein [Flavobacteriales bacterium]
MGEKYRKLSEHNVAICDFADVAMKNPVPFKPENLGPNVNSAYDEYYPGITADNNMLLYTRRIKDKQNYFGEQEDFYVSEKLNGEWAKCYNMGAPINTHYNEGSPTISPDGKIIIFSACDEIDGYGPNRKGYGGCDIFFVKRVGERWSMPVNMGPPISSKAWDVQPSYASDGTTLYFVSQRKGSLGDADIWVSTLTDKGVWGSPENLGPTINTEGREEAVFIHPDNQTLYFASNGHVGMGGLDIFVSKRQEDGSWGEPLNLGYPINTFNDENGLIVAAGGETAYFSSNREGGQGGLDMYQFELHEGVRPIKVTYMKGKVFDSKSKKNLSSRFELIDLETGKVVVESYSDRVTGEFLICLPVNKNYALNVSRKGYVFYSDNFSLKKPGTSSDPFLIDVPLQRIGDGVYITLKNIFYETGSYELRKSSFAELGKLMDFLNKNEKLIVEIEGHTDDVGDLKSNLILSENRARSVYQYLLDKGVPEERLSFKGYGETQPIRPNTNEADRAKNRRTVFKIISFE